MNGGEGKIGTNSYISIALTLALVMTIAGVAYANGVQSQKIADLNTRVERQESYASDVATMKEQMRQFNTTLAEVRSDVKDIKQSGTVRR